MLHNNDRTTYKQANQHTCKTLLNCYIREFGQSHPNDMEFDLENGTYKVMFPAWVNDTSLAMAASMAKSPRGAAVAHRPKPMSVSGKLHYYSLMGEHEYTDFRTPDGEEIDCRDMIQYIINELRQRYLFVTIEQGEALALHVLNSCQKIGKYLEQASGYEVHNYVQSEQSLLYGHPFHPFPKNTIGFTNDEAEQYSPELRVSFRLCYIAVKNEVYQEEWVLGSDRTPWCWPESVETQARRILQENREHYQLLPVHPWQYEHVLKMEPVLNYVRCGALIPLGSCGPYVYPTSSVRTVYMPELACNLKLPLDIQITNLRRNNSREQMRRTLDAANYLRSRNCFGNEVAAAIAYEEGVCGCHFEDADMAKLLMVAYRPIEYDVTSTFVLSSLTEASKVGESCRLFSLIDRGVPIEEWLRRYLEISLLPIVRAAEEHGIHFEAHLQNTLLTLRDGLPYQFIIRDLEGVSVERGKALADVDASGPLYYEQDQCWARTDYYFIVNHMGSFIHALAMGVKLIEQELWDVVRDVLSREHENTRNEYVHHLLTADVFYAKKNLMSCLAGQSENPDYAPVNNPMKGRRE